MTTAVEAKYEIKEELGRGEFSVVHLAIDKATKEKFAIKIVEKNDTDTSRLETEVSILTKVDHPNIICLKEHFDTPKKLYLVMEMVTGGELFNKIIEVGSYSEKLAAETVKKILEAVLYLHGKGIVHRDLKPTNLLLKSTTSLTDIKIADFGLSKILGNNAMMQTACGTPIYVAPEVLGGEPYDKEVDLWSVGVILYILLCGFPPFFDDGSNMGMLFEQIMSGEFDYPSPYWDGISSAAKDLINGLLVVDPKKRLSAEQALKHPWVTSSGGDAETPLKVGPSLKDFKEGKSTRTLKK